MRTMLVLLVIGCVPMMAQDPAPGTAPWTPMVTGGLSPVSIRVPAAFASVGLDPIEHRINVPDGWTANVYAAGPLMQKLRFLCFGPDSVLYGANMGRGTILAMPDRDRDGVADTVYVAASGFAVGHDVRFWGDTMYVSHQAGITKLWDVDGDGTFESRQTVFDRTTLPNQTGGHTTRTLVIDTIGRKLYCNLGSFANADREPNRAVIEQFDLDGSGRRFYATGVRNAVGMTLHPRTGRLWANNNGSDLQGNNVPGEWVDLVRDGGFYGHPIAWAHQQYFNFDVTDYKDILPITAQDSALVRTMRPPAALITAHSAPMGLAFTPLSVAPRWRYGAFMALRGSWNRTPASGSKVVYLEFDDDNDTVANSVHDFCTGFLTDSINKVRWARPVGIEIGADGSVYVSSDDIKHFVLKLTPPAGPSSTQEQGALRGDVRIAPQPAIDEVRIMWPSAPSDATMEISDLNGRVLRTTQHRQHEVQQGVMVSTRILASGTYVVHLRVGERAVQLPFVIAR